MSRPITRGEWLTLEAAFSMGPAVDYALIVEAVHSVALSHDLDGWTCRWTRTPGRPFPGGTADDHPPPGAAFRAAPDEHEPGPVSGGHWAALSRAKKDVETAVWAVAKQRKVPRLDRCVAALIWYPPRQVRLRDPDGLGIMVKACLDGLQHAGVLEGDDSSRVAGVLLRVAEPDGDARVELVLVDGDGPDWVTELFAA